MQIVILVFLDSLRCALSHNICHYRIFGRRHIGNLIRRQKRVKTGSTNLLREINYFYIIVFSLGPVHEFVCISFRTGNLNFFRVK